MKTKFRTISLRTEHGFDQAEKLQARGWQVGSVGFETIQMYKTEKNENRR